MTGESTVTDEQYLDLDDCARLLGLPSRQLRKLVRERRFPEPARQDGGSLWREQDVLRWAAQDPQQAARIPLRYWPDADTPAAFVGATRFANRHGLDDVVLTWATPARRVGVLWRPRRPGDPLPVELLDEAGTAVLIRVDADFGPRGPSLTASNRARPEEYLLGWPELARVLGQDLPYWPYLLRDPDLIAAWRPGAPAVTAPARTDLDAYPLLRMAAMFDADHPTARTLVNLVQIDQRQATRSAHDDLRRVTERAQRLHGRGTNPGIVAAAEPLAIGDPDVDVEDLDATTARIGWIELLSRADTLSWQCVRQALLWDGGRHFAFAHPVRVDTTTQAAREWVHRLEPVHVRTAAFACIDDGGGRAMIDPLTGAPAVLLDDGTAVTAVPQRLPAHSRRPSSTSRSGSAPPAGSSTPRPGVPPTG
jgi:predicted DNA-binding transcriptional regulator AlpA